MSLLTVEAVNALARELVGRPYSDFQCWPLARHCFSRHGVDLPESAYSAIRRFEPVEVPRAWDVIVLCNATDRNGEPTENHVGLMLSSTTFLHSMNGFGVTIGFITRSPWNQPGRIARYLRLKE